MTAADLRRTLADIARICQETLDLSCFDAPGHPEFDATWTLATEVKRLALQALAEEDANAL